MDEVEDVVLSILLSPAAATTVTFSSVFSLSTKFEFGTKLNSRRFTLSLSWQRIVNNKPGYRQKQGTLDDQCCLYWPPKGHVCAISTDFPRDVGRSVGWLVSWSVCLQNILKNSKRRFPDYYGGCDLFSRTFSVGLLVP